MERYSPFMNLPYRYVKMPYFFPPDAMHDLFEGISHLIVITVFSEVLDDIDVSIGVINKL